MSCFLDLQNEKYPKFLDISSLCAKNYLLGDYKEIKWREIERGEIRGLIEKSISYVPWALP